MNKEQQIIFAKNIAAFGINDAVKMLPYELLDKNVQGIIDEYEQARYTLFNLISNEVLEELEPLSQL